MMNHSAVFFSGMPVPAPFQNEVLTPATQEDLDKELSTLNDEVNQIEMKYRGHPSYQASVAALREKFLFISDQLTRLINMGDSRFNLRTQAQIYAKEIRACEDSICAPSPNFHGRNAQISREIEGLNFGADPLPLFRFPEQKQLKECIRGHLPGGPNPYFDEKRIPEKVAAFFQNSVKSEEGLVIGVDQTLESVPLPLPARGAAGMHFVVALRQCSVNPELSNMTRFGVDHPTAYALLSKGNHGQRDFQKLSKADVRDIKGSRLLLYVIKTSGELIISQQRDSRNERIQHLHLANKEPVYAAGTISVLQGEIIGISKESGGYRPRGRDLTTVIRTVFSNHGFAEANHHRVYRIKDVDSVEGPPRIAPAADERQALLPMSLSQLMSESFHCQ
jgi:hypothetical protein